MCPTLYALSASLRSLRLRGGVIGVANAPPVVEALRISGCAATHRAGAVSEAENQSLGQCGEVLALDASAAGAARPLGAWPAASTPALAHPGLATAAAIARSYGARLSIDTSLSAAPLRHIGGYFSGPRGTLAIAVDSSWAEAVHELTHAVHELTHAAFEATSETLARRFRDASPRPLPYQLARVHRPTSGAGSSSATAARTGTAADVSAEPLHTHWWGAEGVAELVCREHELHALRRLGAAACHRFRARPRAAHTRELRRMRAVLLLIGGRARLVYLAAAAVAATASLSALLRSVGLGPRAGPAGDSPAG
ncbi:hypothetical protein EMIHUDRAFT_358863 [Emiliania huxleyi CCMP1516]|uniref:Uncharacterized protein n=2 Tax=Emiliania huxleyi TaxID=2903 RepID=A0A0D3IAR2_EMIH1|nr:hypothetical protein EMIHUDRAFT_358863 [Emiliania huxleyi CCMP1516]EOD08347.1 hypothetical protein EMIHUDRAFT_358863 [Emiliania huxleyi CCMP1516]|eukprot:XP_005760776.1 hypothetical protein EMIHUDRAFT_358863 [Emiliania huxleyi CCMP1516]